MRKISAIIAIILMLSPMCGLVACGSGDSGNGGGELSVISCPEQGFTTKADPSYTWRYVEGDGITIWTVAEDSIPFVLVFQTDGRRNDSYRHLCEVYTPYMRDEYGDDLLDVEEYEAYEIGGKKLPAALYTYKNWQGYTLQMLRLEDSTGEYTVQYTAKYQQGYGEDTLAALDTAIRNFRNTSGGNTPRPSKSDSTDPGEDEFTIIPAESKTVQYEKYDNGMISMEIPKGWQVTVGSPAGEYIGYAFSVKNPEDIRYQLFSSILMIIYSGNEQVSKYYKQYGLTVINLNPVTVENFFRSICATSDLNFKVVENLGMTPSGDSGTVHAILTDSNGVSCEGLYSAELDVMLDASEYAMYGFDPSDFMTDMVNAYGPTYIQAPEGELVNWMEPLIHCLTTLTYSDAFMQGYNAEWQQIFRNITNTSAIIAKTGSEISDIITSGYEERQSTYDIISQKQSDATMGYERVYDTETGEIYKAYNGFTDDISTDNYLSERYQTVTDNMYLEGIDGYIEKFQNNSAGY